MPLNFIKNAFFLILYTGIVFGAGFFISEHTREEKIKIVKQTEIQYVPVVREYSRLTRDDCIARLQCYDTSAPMLNAEVKENMIHLTAGLCERRWERGIYVESASSSSWRYYVGIGVTGLVIGGIAAWKLK